MDGHPSVMSGADFARLIDRSQMAVSKYRSAGHLVTDAEDKILPHESLMALEGHMEEENRLLGLRRLLGEDDFELTTSAPGDPVRSAKAEHDEIKRDLARITLAQAAGELVEVAEVERRAYDAVAKMREAQDGALSETVEALTVELNLPPDRAAMVKKHLRRMNSRAFAAFSAAMIAEADVVEPRIAPLEVAEA